MGTVERTFQIVEEVVAHQERGLSFSGVVSRTHLPKASVHRILKALVHVGYLRFDEEGGRYYGDVRLSRLGSEVMSHFDLKGYVRPRLLRLHTETGHTCHLGIRSGEVGIYLDKLESAEAYGIKLFSEVGTSFPLHCTGMGKVLLAFGDPQQCRTVLSRRLRAYTRHTITDPHKLDRELKRVRACGYAVDREEITRGIMCVAAPILAGDGKVLGAVSVTFPAYVNADRSIDKEIAAVTRCTAAIASRLADAAG